ncbi:MAG: alpha-L-fucosidase, partial [Candidatus Sulfotelmatobacter sp.]
MRLREGRGATGREHIEKLTGGAPVATWAVALLVVMVAVTASAQTNGAAGSYVPSAENLKARREFQDMKFGMFIHWGVY